MIRITTARFSEHIDHYQDAALAQPIMITRDDLDCVVMISAGEYRRLKRRDRWVFRTADLPDDIVEAISNARMDPRHDHLNELLQDWKP